MSEGSVVFNASRGQGTALADRYDLREVLGRGGMADVYRGTDSLLQRPVAVTVLREPGLTGQDDDIVLTAPAEWESRVIGFLTHQLLGDE